MPLDDLDKEAIGDILNEPSPSFNPSDTTVIYLDQNQWGFLLEGRNDPDSEYAAIHDQVQQSTDDGTAVYPFSLTRQMETDDHADLTFRRKLYELILDLSQNICFKNYFDVTRAERIAYLKSTISGQPAPDATENVFDHGIVAPLGMPSIPALDDEDNNKFQELLRSERVARELIQDDDYLKEAAQHQQQTDEQDLEKRERARKQSKELADTDERRWEIILAQNLVQGLLPPLKLNAEQVNINIEPYIYHDLQEHDFNTETFLPQFPAFYCQTVLSHGRDFHWDRELEANDLEDMMSLAVAIPYSDIVVTEGFFAGVAYKHDLHERFDTQVLTNITDLSDHLPK